SWLQHITKCSRINNRLRPTNRSFSRGASSGGGKDRRNFFTQQVEQFLMNSVIAWVVVRTCPVSLTRPSAILRWYTHSMNIAKMASRDARTPLVAFLLLVD